MRIDLIERIFSKHIPEYEHINTRDAEAIYGEISLAARKILKVMSIEEKNLINEIAAFRVLTNANVRSREGWNLYKNIKNSISEYQRLVILGQFVKRFDYVITHLKEIKTEFYSLDIQKMKQSKNAIKKRFIESNEASIKILIGD